MKLEFREIVLLEERLHPQAVLWSHLQELINKVSRIAV
jgi:hypothetical protein